MMHLRFASMLPSFAARDIDPIDDFEFLSIPEDNSDYDVESLADTLSSDGEPLCVYNPCWSDTSDEWPAMTWSDWTIPTQHGPSYHDNSVIFGKPWDVAESAEEQAEIQHCSLPVTDIRSMAMAGRGDARHTFKDMRSGRRNRRRLYAEAEKYYGFRYVPRGVVLGGRTEVDKVVPKREIYELAQDWPRPPTRSRRSALKDRYPWSCKYEARLYDARYLHLDCDESRRFDDLVEDFDVQEMRWEIAHEKREEDEVPQVPLLAFVKGKG